MMFVCQLSFQSVRQDGKVQIWSLEEARLIGGVSIETQVSFKKDTLDLLRVFIDL